MIFLVYRPVFNIHRPFFLRAGPIKQDESRADLSYLHSLIIHFYNQLLETEQLAPICV